MPPILQDTNPKLYYLSDTLSVNNKVIKKMPSYLGTTEKLFLYHEVVKFE